MTISGRRTEQHDIFCHVTGFTSDFPLWNILSSFTEPFNCKLFKLFRSEYAYIDTHMRTHLLASFESNLGKPVTECQSILGFTTATDREGGDPQLEL